MKVIINGKETDIEIPDNMKLKGNEKIEKIDGKWCKVKYSITEEEIIKELKSLSPSETAIERNYRFI